MDTKIVTNLSRFERQRGAWLGLAVADALGAPWEFMSAESIAAAAPARLSMRTSRIWEAGEWTDDTDLTLAASAAYSGDVFEVSRAADAMVAWLRAGPKDVGNLTRVGLGAIAREEVKADAAGAWAMRNVSQSAGNGSLMRALPTGLRRAAADPRLDAESAALSEVTHAEARCVQACVAYNVIVARLLEGCATSVAVEAAYRRVEHLEVRAVLKRCLDGAPGLYAKRDAIGFVLLALEVALMALRDSAGYESGIDAVIRFGGDTDTNAAIAGGLLGAKFGDGAIPGDWLSDLQGLPRLEKALRELLRP